MAGHVLVTGAGGLVGRCVLEALPDAVAATGVDLLEPGAFTELLRATQPAAVVHLAWVASSTPGYRTDPANPRWREVTREAAYAAVESGVHFVATGSALDDQPGADPYSEAKAGLRVDLADLAADERLTWLRPHYVFDPATPSPAVLRAAHEAQQRGEPVVLNAPHAEHDFVHVRDVGHAVATVVRHRLLGVVDVGFGMLTAVHTLVEKFGASWAEADHVTTTAGSDSTADVSPLTRCGWHPTETGSFLS